MRTASYERQYDGEDGPETETVIGVVLTPEDSETDVIALLVVDESTTNADGSHAWNVRHVPVDDVTHGDSTSTSTTAPDTERELAQMRAELADVQDENQALRTENDTLRAAVSIVPDNSPNNPSGSVVSPASEGDTAPTGAEAADTPPTTTEGQTLTAPTTGDVS